MKTAVELKKESLFRSKAWIKNDLFIFNENEFDEFCERLCYEQRYRCQQEYNKRSIHDVEGNWYVACEDILKEEMPDL